MACRIARTSEWTTRILHELQGKDGSFITLTYDDDHLPANGSLVKRDLQLFIKRLRKYAEPDKLKYFACGEYGENSKRCHYHIIVIGWAPDIKECYKPNKKQVASREIERLWEYGNNTVGSPDREAIQYVVGYIRKKLSGDPAQEEYYDLKRIPPFQLQSKGLGLEFAKAHKDMILSDRGITRNGRNVGIPRYYRKKLIDKGSYEELEYYRKCEERQYEEFENYIESLDDLDVVSLRYYEDRLSDQERRRKHLEARKRLYNSGKL